MRAYYRAFQKLGKAGGVPSSPLSTRSAAYKAILSILIALGLLTSCNPTGSSPPQPSYTCLSQSAVSYAAEHDLSFLPVSHMDETEGCFTTEERDFLDLLDYAYDTNIATQTTLEDIVQSFPTIGPATVTALSWGIIAYLNDAAENPAIGPFQTRYIGIFPLIDPKNVSQITVNGKTYTLPALVENFGFPSREADPSINPNIIQAVPYTPYLDAESFSPPDWKNMTDGEILTELGLWAGCEDKCILAEDAPITSYDHSIHVPYTIENGEITFHPKILRAFLITPVPAKVIAIDRDESFAERNDNGITPHYMYGVSIRWEVDPRDYPLLGNDVTKLDYRYVHVIPDPTQPFATETAFPYKVGDILQPGDSIGYLSPWLGGLEELDFNILEPFDSVVLGDLFPFPRLPSSMIRSGVIIPVLTGRLYEAGVFTPPSPYPKGYSFLVPPGERFTHPEVFRPAAGHMENGVWVWENIP